MVARSIPRPWPVPRALAAAILAVALVAACGTSDTTPPEVTPDPQTTTAIDGRFEVRFTIDRMTLRPGDEITGTAELWLKAGGSGTVWGPADLFGFEFVEVGGGNRAVTPVFDTNCSPHQVGSDQPLRAPLAKTGATTGAPNDAFVTEFLRGREIHLPAGDWDITAIADFNEARGCSGLPHPVRATLRVRVNG